MPKKKARKTSKVAVRTTPSSSARSNSVVQNMSSGHFSFMQLAILFVALFIINSLVFYLANLLFPGNVVLGTHMIDKWTALFGSMLILSAIGVGATPLIEVVSDAFNIKMGMREWTVLYFILNAVAIWFISRMAEMVGLGISSWFVVVILAVILDMLQGMVAGFVSSLQPSRGA